MRVVILCICFLGTVFDSSLDERKDWIYPSIEGVIQSVDPTALEHLGANDRFEAAMKVDGI